MLFEKLTVKERRLIENYIMNFGPPAERRVCGNFSSLEYRLRHWEESKTEYLARLFNNQLILEKEIVMQEPLQQLQRKISNALWDTSNPMNTLYKLLMEQPSWSWEQYMDLSYLFNSDNLAKNRILCLKTPIKFVYENQTIQFAEGSKPIKIIGKLASLMGYKKEFEEFRLEHSRILNQKELKGTLCLSIHPLDYMTMSDNASGWSSCMSWRENGCYRAGTIEMMNSPCVVVAYLKSAKENLTWDSGTWNNKHWRTLIIVSPETIVNIKNYPYRNDELTEKCLQWLRQLAIDNLNWSYMNETCVLWPYNSNSDIDILGRAVYFRPTTDVMYNDCDDGYPLAFINPNISAEVKICYSGERNCMCCGHYLDIEGDDGESYVFCSDCIDHETYYSCDKCNTLVTENEIYWVDGIPYCSECYEKYCDECAITQEAYNREDLVKVYLTKIPNAPNEKTDEWVYVHKGYPEKWRSLFSWHGRALFSGDAEIRNKDDIYYFNITDLTAIGLIRLYDINDVDSYIND